MGEEHKAFTWLLDAFGAIKPSLEEKESYFHAELCGIFSRLLCRRGGCSEAVRFAKIALEELRDYGRLSFVAEAQLDLAHAERACEKQTEALQLIDEVLPQTRQMGWKQIECQAEYLRGELELELGHADLSATSVWQALSLAREIGLKEEEVKCLLSLGKILTALEQFDGAHEVLIQARQLSQERDYTDHFHNAEVLLQSLSDVKKQRTKETRLSLSAIASASLESNDQAFVGNDYSVQVGVSRVRSEDLAEETSDVTITSSGIDKSLAFDVLLRTSENIELTTEWHKTLLYDPHNLDAQFVQFTFRVTARGASFFVVDFYYERRWLNTMRLEFDAVEKPLPSLVAFAEV